MLLTNLLFTMKHNESDEEKKHLNYKFKIGEGNGGQERNSYFSKRNCPWLLFVEMTDIKKSVGQNSFRSNRTADMYVVVMDGRQTLLACFDISHKLQCNAYNLKHLTSFVCCA